MTADPQTALVDVFRLIVPEIILVVGACVLFLGATFRVGRDNWAAVALITIIVAGLALWVGPSPSTVLGDVAHWGGMAFQHDVLTRLASLESLTYLESVRYPLILDPFALFIKAFALIGGLVLVFMSWDEVPDRQAAEYHGCLLLIVAGICFTGAANELVTLFLALELISIPTYVLLYLPRYDDRAQEAAMKYFLLSIFSSALFLFGFSYLYGIAGTTNLPALQAVLRSAEGETEAAAGLPVIALVALALVVAGLGFFITAVPFHFYAPDVYQGTPAVAAALLAFAPKAAGFFALFRVLGFVGDLQVTSGWAADGRVSMIFYSLAAVTMTLGSILALLQDNIKRLLAYSSVTHAGYMLISLTVAPSLEGEDSAGGLDAVMFYLVAYGAMTVGAFGVVSYLSTRERPVETIDDFAGLGVSRPGVALMMTVFLASLIGIPLTAGFVGKFLIFIGALWVPAANHPWLFRSLAILAVVNATIGGWYYLRILAVMYFRTALRPLEPRRSSPSLAALWICVLVTLVFGVWPEPLRQASHRAVVYASNSPRP
jgi:NADH-quinone oxidoreductase subunit N